MRAPRPAGRPHPVDPKPHSNRAEDTIQDNSVDVVPTILRDHHTRVLPTLPLPGFGTSVKNPENEKLCSQPMKDPCLGRPDLQRASPHRSLHLKLDEFRFIRLLRAGLDKSGHADSTWSCVSRLQLGRSVCPPACCITPSASVATTTPAPTIRTAKSSSPSSKTPRPADVPHAARLRSTPAAASSAASDRCRSAAAPPSSPSRSHASSAGPVAWYARSRSPAPTRGVSIPAPSSAMPWSWAAT